MVSLSSKKANPLRSGRVTSHIRREKKEGGNFCTQKERKKERKTTKEEEEGTFFHLCKRRDARRATSSSCSCQRHHQRGKARGAGGCGQTRKLIPPSGIGRCGKTTIEQPVSSWHFQSASPSLLSSITSLLLLLIRKAFVSILKYGVQELSPASEERSASKSFLFYQQSKKKHLPPLLFLHGCQTGVVQFLQSVRVCVFRTYGWWSHARELVVLKWSLRKGGGN